MPDRLSGHHLTHITAAARVADHGGAAADEGDGPVAGLLQTLHQAQSHKMAHVEGVCRGVKADVEGRLAVVDHLADLGFVGHLCDQTARLQFFINSHLMFSPLSFLPEQKKALCPVPDRGRKNFAVPPLVRRFLTEATSRSAVTLPRNNGRTRSTPTQSHRPFSLPARRCISSAALSSLHRPEALLTGRFRLLLRFNAVTSLIVANVRQLVKSSAQPQRITSFARPSLRMRRFTSSIAPPSLCGVMQRPKPETFFTAHTAVL